MLFFESRNKKIKKSNVFPPRPYSFQSDTEPPLFSLYKQMKNKLRNKARNL